MKHNENLKTINNNKNNFKKNNAKTKQTVRTYNKTMKQRKLKSNKEQ